MSFQQRKAQFLLQCLDLLGDGRLRDMAFFRRFRKTVIAYHRLKISDLSEQKPTSR